MVSYAAPMMTTMAAPNVAYGTTTMAAPVSYAAPVTYAAPQVMQAPTVVETVSAAPMMQTYAAPVAEVDKVNAFGQVVERDIVVPQSYLPGTMNIIPTPAAPVAPPKLTEGIPTPAQINSQKAGYSAALDKQLAEALDTVKKETAIEKQMVQFSADKSVALFNNGVDERLAQSMAAVDEEQVFRTLELKKALVERGLQLDQQASNLVMDYEVKALQFEWGTKRYAFEQEYKKAEGKLEGEFAAQAKIANAAIA